MGKGVALALFAVFAAAGPGCAQAVRAPDTVVVSSGTLRLRGLLWRPAGSGPFPAVLFNHGSGRTQEAVIRGGAGLALGPMFARHGYVFLLLFRRGTGLSAGQAKYGGDLLDSALARHGQAARNRLQLRLLEGDQLRDALAGLAFLRARPDVDRRRLAVMGHSFGGSLTLLVAERDSALRAAVVFGAAAFSWSGSPELRRRLIAAVDATRVPVLFIHAGNDYSVAPGRRLAAEMARLRKPHALRIYAAYGRTASDGHNFVFLDPAAWQDDVFAFLDARMRP